MLNLFPQQSPAATVAERAEKPGRAVRRRAQRLGHLMTKGAKHPTSPAKSFLTEDPGPYEPEKLKKSLSKARKT